MELGSSSFLHKLVGKKLIAYGTGHAGKLIIPFLANSIQVQLIGVTNSKVQDSFCTAYLDTGLPLRSLQEWVQLEPDASVLITAFRGYGGVSRGHLSSIRVSSGQYAVNGRFGRVTYAIGFRCIVFGKRDTGYT